VFILLIAFNISDDLHHAEVYVTPTGYCYHTSNCRTFRGGRCLTIENAQKERYYQCSLCHPFQHVLAYSLLGYAFIACFSFGVFSIFQAIIDLNEKRKKQAIKKAEADEFCLQYNQKRASEVFGMPKYYYIGPDFIPMLVPTLAHVYGVYASSSSYHLAHCKYAKGNPISRYQASELKLAPCRMCTPEAPGEKWYYLYYYWARKAHSLGVIVNIRDDIITVTTEKSD
jgi:hypothetical protein